MLHIIIIYDCVKFQGKLVNQTWENGQKTSFGSDFGPSGPNSGRQFFCFLLFFSKICLGQSLYIMVSYHHVQYQKKEQKIIQPWENLVTDGQTDRQTDRQTDDIYFIGRYPTNVERPT